jgi:hypothetical protein
MTTTTTILPWPLVSQGDQAHPVPSLQYLLRARGHSVAVDGIFWPRPAPLFGRSSRAGALRWTASSGPTRGPR